MKVSGFTILRNGIKYGYPFRESILSILPICDEFVVAVGNCNDNSREALIALNEPKIKIIDTIWNESLRENGEVLADETNKAFRAISSDSDWAFYLQADEVVHEQYLPIIQNSMQLHLENKAVDGLLFNYLHFWGSYDYVGKSSRWYPHEIRVIRNDANIYSYRDAQGFRKLNNEKLRVKEMAAWVYHYGWVREPATMKRKYEGVGKFWGGKEMPEDQEYNNGNQFDYSDVDMLAPFDGSHPKVMNETIQSKNWHFEYDPNLHKLPLKERFKNFVQKIVGRRIFDYKNYKIVQ